MDPLDAKAVVSLINDLASQLQIVSQEEAEPLGKPDLIPPFRSWDQKRSVLRRLFQQKSALEKTIADAQKDESPAVAVASMAQVNLG